MLTAACPRLVFDMSCKALKHLHSTLILNALQAPQERVGDGCARERERDR